MYAAHLVVLDPLIIFCGSSSADISFSCSAQFPGVAGRGSFIKGIDGSRVDNLLLGVSNGSVLRVSDGDRSC